MVIKLESHGRGTENRSKRSTKKSFLLDLTRILCSGQLKWEHDSSIVRCVFSVCDTLTLEMLESITTNDSCRM